MNCPICNKPMVEQPKFNGLWLCEDYIDPTNSATPFTFKCKGMHLTEKGSEAFDAELRRIIQESN